MYVQPLSVYVLRIPSGNFNTMTGNNAVPQLADITYDKQWIGNRIRVHYGLEGGKQDGDLLLEHSPFEINPISIQEPNELESAKRTNTSGRSELTQGFLNIVKSYLRILHVHNTTYAENQ